MSVHDNNKLEEWQAKYGLRSKRLEFERADVLEAIQTEVNSEGKAYREYISKLKSKYGLKAGLEFEKGITTSNETTLSQILDERAKDELKGLQCCVGRTEFFDKPVRLALEIRL